MSHYQYNPKLGYFISLLPVKLSIEEMRHEYYEEKKQEIGIRNEVKKRRKTICDNFSNNKRIKVSNNTNEEICKLNYQEEKPPEKQDEILRRKRHHESDDEETPSLKRQKIVFDEPHNINSAFDVLSTSIMNTYKKSTRKLKKRIKINYKNKSVDEREHCRSLNIELRKMGNDLIKSGDYEGAHSKYTEALTIETDESLTALNYSNRGFALMKLDRFQEALDDYNAALAHNRLETKAQLRRIKCLMELSRFDDAKLDITDFSSRNSEFDSECRELLEIIKEKERFTELVVTAQRSQASGDHAAANEGFSSALKIDCSCGYVFRDRAQALFSLGKYRESLSDASEALRLDPFDERSMTTRITCLVQLERFAEAIRDAENLVKRQPGSRQHRKLLRDSLECERRARDRNHYEVFGVDRRCSAADIKRRYRALARQFHPDKYADDDPETRAFAQEHFKLLAGIFRTLSDPVSRSMYDMEL